MLFRSNIHSGGTFNHNNGTVTLTTKWRNANNKPTARIYIEDGPGAGRDFYNLRKTGRKNIYLGNDIEIKNNLSIIGNGYIYAQDLGGTNYDITIGGNWYQNKNTSFKARSGKVIFNGSSAQTIDSRSNFNTLRIYNSDVSLIRAATVTGTLRIFSGATLDINGYNLTAGTLNNTGNLQLKGTETLTITTKDTDSGTITYDGSATGLKYGNTYYNLAINSPSGTMTLNADLDVNGSLTIANGKIGRAHV